jgi:hypothetical protein
LIRILGMRPAPVLGCGPRLGGVLGCAPKSRRARAQKILRLGEDARGAVGRPACGPAGGPAKP